MKFSANLGCFREMRHTESFLNPVILNLPYAPQTALVRVNRKLCFAEYDDWCSVVTLLELSAASATLHDSSFLSFFTILAATHLVSLLTGWSLLLSLPHCPCLHLPEHFSLGVHHGAVFETSLIFVYIRFPGDFFWSHSFKWHN